MMMRQNLRAVKFAHNLNDRFMNLIPVTAMVFTLTTVMARVLVLITLMARVRVREEDYVDITVILSSSHKMVISRVIYFNQFQKKFFSETCQEVVPGNIFRVGVAVSSYIYRSIAVLLFQVIKTIL